MIIQEATINLCNHIDAIIDRAQEMRTIATWCENDVTPKIRRKLKGALCAYVTHIKDCELELVADAIANIPDEL